MMRGEFFGLRDKETFPRIPRFLRFPQNRPGHLS